MTPTRHLRGGVSSTNPGLPTAYQFLVGRNRCGHWVARDQEARSGGLFKTREDAVRFASREHSDVPDAVIVVPELLELFEASKATGRSPQIEEE